LKAPPYDFTYAQYQLCKINTSIVSDYEIYGLLDHLNIFSSSQLHEASIRQAAITTFYFFSRSPRPLISAQRLLEYSDFDLVDPKAAKAQGQHLHRRDLRAWILVFVACSTIPRQWPRALKKKGNRGYTLEMTSPQRK